MTPPVCVARLSGVTLRYRHTVAVDAVDLDIPAACMCGFIGPDGVGKSSLLALISGARTIQVGRVDVLGGDMAQTRHRRAVCSRIAYMPQGRGKNLYPTLSVCENVDFFGRLFGQSAAERAWRIRELLTSTGLAPFADIQLNVDATAMTQAGTGAGYIQSIIAQELTAFLGGPAAATKPPVALVIRAQFNPNLEVASFMAVVQLINSITLLAMFLAGAALIREREHGTIEHLLVMPLTPTEIMLAKIWANGLVIVVATTLSLRLVGQWGLGLAIAGSVALFVAGVVIYLFAIASLSIFLATLARSMPQFALLAFPLFIIMNLLSGGNTPVDSMPQVLQTAMQGSPSTHFVSVAQAILYRGAGFDIVWREFAATAAIGAGFFVGALLRFRKTLTAMQT